MEIRRLNPHASVEDIAMMIRFCGKTTRNDISLREFEKAASATYFGGDSEPEEDILYLIPYRSLFPTGWIS